MGNEKVNETHCGHRVHDAVERQCAMPAMKGIVHGVMLFGLGLATLFFVLFVLPRSGVEPTHAPVYEEQLRKTLFDRVRPDRIERNAVELARLHAGALASGRAPDVAQFVMERWKQLRLHEVHTFSTRPEPAGAGSRSVIAYIPGQYDPDTYVLLGASLDAHDAAVPALLESAAAIAEVMAGSEWRPWRTLVLCAWAEPERAPRAWLKANQQILAGRAAVYVHVDRLSPAAAVGHMATADARQAAWAAARSVPAEATRIGVNGSSSGGGGGGGARSLAAAWKDVDEAGTLTLQNGPSEAAAFSSHLGVPLVVVGGRRRQATSATAATRLLNAGWSDQRRSAELALVAALFVTELARRFTDYNPLPLVPIDQADQLLDAVTDFRRHLSATRRTAALDATLGELGDSLRHWANESATALEEAAQLNSARDAWPRGQALSRRIQCQGHCFLRRQPDGSTLNIIYDGAGSISASHPNSLPSAHQSNSGPPLPHLRHLLQAYTLRRVDAVLGADAVRDEVLLVRRAAHCAAGCWRKFL